MFEYKFVRLKTNMWTNQMSDDHQAVIQEHAEEGWRLVQIFSPIGMSMQPMFYELIFERLKSDYV
jgi:hypothetical protein